MKNEKENNAELKRHSLAHIMAAAIKEEYTEAKLAIGPAIENGFYYDIDFGDTKISDSDLPKIEKKMIALINQGLSFAREEKNIDQALREIDQAAEPYKYELVSDLKEKGENSVSFYTVGSFTDLCRGPHVENTKEIAAKSFRLQKLAGAYWRGSEKNKMLTRIYGLAFETKEELSAYDAMMLEAEKRDHRKLGKELDIFMTHEYAPGMPFFLPKGMIILQELIKFVRAESYGPGYKEVRTPHLFNDELWKISGHWGHYQEDMFCLHHAEDDIDMGIKPMNCPAHMLIFKRDIRSYKELPLRIAETSTLYRNEKSGTLHGLTRVRSLSQDDSHIFLRPEQIIEEISDLLKKIKHIYQVFGLEIDEIHLSTRPEEFLGERAVWDEAEESLKKALGDAGLNYQINEGDGAFYGPKIDVKVKDAIGRQWQLATIQLDYQMPIRFDLNYIDNNGQEKRPVVLHRALLGSMERFLGIIIEHFSGAMPLWLAPVQVKLLPVSEKHLEYCKKLADKLIGADLRVEIDESGNTIGNKIRTCAAEKIPYQLVIGDQEAESENLSVRAYGNRENKSFSQTEFIKNCQEKISTRSLEL
ncbi:MAG: threonine--tRNA ligase [Candidatus Falkowbacteria bacterium]|nr:threonine--tRNA ligase [Candidatus Falkowbacteria bacterium]